MAAHGWVQGWRRRVAAASRLLMLAGWAERPNASRRLVKPFAARHFSPLHRQPHDDKHVDEEGREQDPPKRQGCVIVHHPAKKRKGEQGERGWSENTSALLPLPLHSLLYSPLVRRVRSGKLPHPPKLVSGGEAQIAGMRAARPRLTAYLRRKPNGPGRPVIWELERIPANIPCDRWLAGWHWCRAHHKVRSATHFNPPSFPLLVNFILCYQTTVVRWRRLQQFAKNAPTAPSVTAR